MPTIDLTNGWHVLVLGIIVFCCYQGYKAFKK